MEIRHILAPTDYSEFSKQAIEYAFALAQTFGAKLTLLHVIEALPPYIGFIPQGEATTVLENLERQACLDLAKLVPKAEDAKVEITCQAVTGTPYLKIIEVANAMRTDVIVMATHGRTGFNHFVMGSVAERVVRAAPCSVLTMRPPAATVAGRERHAPGERPELVSTLH